MTKVLIIAGGPSTEHDVSISTAKNIMQGIDKHKYEASLAYISKEGNWRFGSDFDSLTEQHKLNEALGIIRTIKPDIALLALHGTFGEDGKIQAILDEIKVRYTGSSSHSSALAMDKFASEQVMEENGLKIIESMSVWRSDWPEYEQELMNKAKQYGDSIIVKPNDGGSSIGVIKCVQDNLKDSIEEVLKMSEHVLIQPYIAARELSCGIVEIEGKPSVLPITEIIPDKKSEFFDFDSKYDNDSTQEITPANINKAVEAMVSDYTLKCHTQLGCSGYSRSDFLLDGDDVYFLETNTLPGLTASSILPRQAQAQGITYQQLLDLIIQAGLK